MLILGNKISITSRKIIVNYYYFFYFLHPHLQSTNMTVQEYALQVPVDAPRHVGYLGFNQMVWDFGMPKENMNNLTAVQELVSGQKSPMPFPMSIHTSMPSFNQHAV